jgi:hypothetical protein
MAQQRHSANVAQHDFCEGQDSLVYKPERTPRRADVQKPRINVDRATSACEPKASLARRRKTHLSYSKNTKRILDQYQCGFLRLLFDGWMRLTL